MDKISIEAIMRAAKGFENFSIFMINTVFMPSQLKSPQGGGIGICGKSDFLKRQLRFPIIIILYKMGDIGNFLIVFDLMYFSMHSELFVIICDYSI